MPQIYRTYVRVASTSHEPVDELATVDNLANLVDRHRVKRLAQGLVNSGAAICISAAQVFDACATFPWTSCTRGQPHSEGNPEWRSIGACPNGPRARAR